MPLTNIWIWRELRTQFFLAIISWAENGGWLLSRLWSALIVAFLVQKHAKLHDLLAGWDQARSCVSNSNFIPPPRSGEQNRFSPLRLPNDMNCFASSSNTKIERVLFCTKTPDSFWKSLVTAEVFISLPCQVGLIIYCLICICTCWSASGGYEWSVKRVPDVQSYRYNFPREGQCVTGYSFWMRTGNGIILHVFQKTLIWNH